MIKKISILGAGESGVGAAILAAQKGYDIYISDKGKILENFSEELKKYDIVFDEEKHDEEKILASDEVIKSPGISDSIEIIQKIKSKNIPIISEIEFASRYSESYIIAITGTDGKTTTASLIYHIMKKAEMDVDLVGNIGKSFARSVAEKNYKYHVVEVSSFQLDDCYTFHPKIAVLTNITADHLERYDYNILNYIKSKFSIAKNQTDEDYFIYNDDDENSSKYIADFSISSTKIPFAYSKENHPGAFIRNGEMQVLLSEIHKPNFIMNINEFSLRGRHNAYNSMAASIATDILEIRKEAVRESLSDFRNIEHRLESCGKIGGIEFINDSKATTVNAAWYALESIDNKVLWIAGGVDKGNDYEKLKPLVKDKVRIIICLGYDNRKIHEAFSNDVDMIVNTTSMQEAVKIAYELGTQGESVLLSPACASFDLFQNYEDRGRQFKRAVKNL